MSSITAPVAALIVATAITTLSAQAPPATPMPQIREQRRVECGLTMITPDGPTRFTMREVTPPPNAPKYAARAVPGGQRCERELPPRAQAPDMQQQPKWFRTPLFTPAPLPR